jgi:hypothetical protein
MEKSQLRERLKRITNISGLEPGKVSVIIPVYRAFDPARVLITIDSLKMQKGVNLEIVVAEQSNNPMLNGVEGINYVPIPDVHKREGNHFIPGLVRNIAVENSSGEFLYNNDGDIIFNNPNFLAEGLKLMGQDKAKIFYRPLMRRLPVECFEDFRDLWENQGIQKALEKLDMSEEYLARTPGANVGMRVFKKFESGREKVFLYTTTDHERYKRELHREGQEPKFSTLDVHGGGILMRKEQFDLVGGYCEEYSAWGCHDADIQWKLKSVFELEQFPYEINFEVLHLDHERGYFDQEMWQLNRSIQKRRRSGDVADAIMEDRKNA